MSRFYISKLLRELPEGSGYHSARHELHVDSDQTGFYRGVILKVISH